MVVEPVEIYEDELSEAPIETGDVFFPIVEFEKANCGGVVLTPICDLTWEKVEWVKLAVAIPFKTYLAEEFIPHKLKGQEEFKKEITQAPKAFGWAYLNDPNKREDIKTLKLLVPELQKVLKNVAPQPSHYYLPGKNDLAQGFLVDFKHIQSVPYHQLKEKTPLLRMKSPWREQLLNRYVTFSSRVGTSDYSEDSICRTIQAFYPELTVESILKKIR